MAHHAERIWSMHPVSLRFRSQVFEDCFRDSRQTTPVFTGILICSIITSLAAAFACIILGQATAIDPMLPGVWATFIQCAIVEHNPLNAALFRRYNHFWRVVGIVLVLVISDPSLSSIPSDPIGDHATCLRLCMHANGMLVLSCCVSWYSKRAHTAEKILGTMIIPAFHIYRPQYGLAPNEEAIHFLTYVLVGHCVGYVVELLERTVFIKQQLQELELHKLQTASACIDEGLNRVILGNCGVARGMLRCLEERLDSRNEQLALSVLQRSQELLDKAAMSCERRQLSVQLQLGNYTSTQKTVRVSNMLRQMTGTDGRVKSSVDEITVDEVVLRLALEEALANARRFRQPGTNILVAAKVEEDFIGTLMLQVSIGNLNADGVPYLSHDACESILRHGYTKRQLSAVFDGMGLAGVAQAARKADGDVQLAMFPSGGTARTKLLVRLPCWRGGAPETNVEAAVHGEVGMALASCTQAGAESASSSGYGNANSTSGTNLHPTSTVMERLSTFESSSELNDGVVDDSRHDVSQQPVGERHARPSVTAVRPLVCIGLDDQAMCRVLHELIFETFLCADPERSGSIGEKQEEIEAFCEVALGKLNLSLSQVPFAQQRQADVVIIDQNLIIGNSCSVLGSDIARQLRQKGFRGIIGILTGSADIEVRRLAALEEVDFAFSKHESAAIIADQITDKLQRIAA